MHKNVGKGGFKCDCCNKYFGKDKNDLNRRARTQLKEADRHLIEEGLEELNE